MLLPQLRTGASVQFGIRRSFAAVRSMTRLPDGSLISGSLTMPVLNRWNLSYRGLTPQEFSPIADFCNSPGATEEGFVFLDPFSNLLAQSEDLTTTSWQRDPTLIVSAPPPNTSGHQEHTLDNTGILDQALSQDLPISGEGTFCFSCSVRSDAPGKIRLAVGSSTGTVSAERDLADDWKQVYVTAPLAISVTPLTVSLSVAPGTTLQASRLQLEQQPYPSPYKPTMDRGGVYAGARVVYESFSVLQQSPDWYDCYFQIEQ